MFCRQYYKVVFLVYTSTQLNHKGRNIFSTFSKQNFLEQKLKIFVWVKHKWKILIIVKLFKKLLNQKLINWRFLKFSSSWRPPEKYNNFILINSLLHVQLWGQPRPKYIRNKCITNIYFFLLYRGLVHHHHRILNLPEPWWIL